MMYTISIHTRVRPARYTYEMHERNDKIRQDRGLFVMRFDRNIMAVCYYYYHRCYYCCIHITRVVGFSAVSTTAIGMRREIKRLGQMNNVMITIIKHTLRKNTVTRYEYNNSDVYNIIYDNNIITSYVSVCV